MALAEKINLFNSLVERRKLDCGEATQILIYFASNLCGKRDTNLDEVLIEWLHREFWPEDDQDFIAELECFIDEIEDARLAEIKRQARRKVE